MLTYNITTKIDAIIQDQWTAFQLNERVPALRSHSFVHDVKLYRLLNQDEGEGFTYVTQISFAGRGEYDLFLKLLPEFRKQENAIWADQFVSFETIMETVH